MNKLLTAIAYVAIIALAALTVHRTEQHAKQLVELQEYHTQRDDTIINTDDCIWNSVEEVIEFRNNEMAWEKTITDWYNIPEHSLRHIVQNHGCHLSIDQMVQIYNTNKEYYKAFEDGVTVQTTQKPLTKTPEAPPSETPDTTRIN